MNSTHPGEILGCYGKLGRVRLLAAWCLGASFIIALLDRFDSLWLSNDANKRLSTHLTESVLSMDLLSLNYLFLCIF